MKNISPLREKHRFEWKNIVISLINSGWGRSDAEIEADQRIEESHDERNWEDEDVGWDSQDDLADYNLNEAADYRDE